MSGERPRLLLHTCCAVCGAYVSKLLHEQYEVTVFFSNSNIWPEEEYIKRLGAARALVKEHNIEIIEDDYNHKGWQREVKGLEKEPEGGARCAVCFRHRLIRAVEYASNNDFKIIATTLPLSPFKNETVIDKILSELAEENNLKHLATDKLPEGKIEIWKKTLALTKELGLYRQKYCGCEFSVR